MSGPGTRIDAAAPSWLAALRRDGQTRFDSLGLGSVTRDGWTAADLVALESMSSAPPVEAPETPAPLEAVPDLGDVYRIVLLDGRPVGRLDAREARPDRPWLTGLASALRDDPERIEAPLMRRAPGELPALAALGVALAEDGAVVVVPPGVEVDRPVHVIHVASGRPCPVALHTRSVVVAGRSSRVTVVETHVGIGDGPYWTNALTDVDVGENAAVEHYRLQIEAGQAVHVSSIACRLAATSRYTSRRLDLGGRIVRHDLACVLDGPGSEATLDALWLARGEQHLTHATVLDHAAEHTASRELYKGVLAGRARGSFHGRIVVRPGAQKTDAKQSNPNLLLSDAALAHTRPQLEIRADDVKCTHGATIGRLDEDAIFYLRTRGVAQSQARRMLVRAFAAEVLERMDLVALREVGLGLLDRALAEPGA
jgi:Fe-S cluster assembly protein SufD